MIKISKITFHKIFIGTAVCMFLFWIVNFFRNGKLKTWHFHLTFNTCHQYLFINIHCLMLFCPLLFIFYNAMAMPMTYMWLSELFRSISEVFRSSTKKGVKPTNRNMGKNWMSWSKDQKGHWSYANDNRTNKHLHHKSCDTKVINYAHYIISELWRLNWFRIRAAVSTFCRNFWQFQIPTP